MIISFEHRLMTIPLLSNDKWNPTVQATLSHGRPAVLPLRRDSGVAARSAPSQQPPLVGAGSKQLQRWTVRWPNRHRCGELSWKWGGSTQDWWFISRKSQSKLDDDSGYPHFRKPPYEEVALMKPALDVEWRSELHGVAPNPQPRWWALLLLLLKANYEVYRNYT